MEALVTIIEVGAYSERQYQKQDGTTEYFKSRGFVLKHGGDIIYGEMTGDLASKNRDADFARLRTKTTPLPPYVNIITTGGKGDDEGAAEGETRV